jgi:hypothetical protein
MSDAINNQFSIRFGTDDYKLRELVVDRLGLMSDAINNQFSIRFGTDDFKLRVGLKQGNEGVFVQMVCMCVARGDNVDEVEALGGHDDLGHADVRFVGGGIFLGEGIRQIRVQQQVFALPLNEETALAEPPKVQKLQVVRAILHVLEKRIIL